MRTKKKKKKEEEKEKQKTSLERLLRAERVVEERPGQGKQGPMEGEGEDVTQTVLVDYLHGGSGISKSNAHSHFAAGAPQRVWLTSYIY